MKIRSLLIIAILGLLASCQPTPSTVSLALLGDLMLTRGIHPAAATLSYLAPDLQTADLSLAALESPLADVPTAANPSSGYNLCAPAGNARWLFAWGLDLLSLANNHRFDCGPDGPSETVGILATAGLVPVGPGPGPVYREVNGLKLAFLAFDDILAPLDGAAAAQAIRSAWADGALVVVSVHWGMEYQGGASERQKALAQQFAQAGAALVVGTHPHVLQPIGWLQTAWGRTLVLYSLGNALFDQPGLADTRQSALVLVTLEANGVRSARAVPFVIDIPASRLVAPDAEVAKQIHLSLGLP